MDNQLTAADSYEEKRSRVHHQLQAFIDQTPIALDYSVTYTFPDAVIIHDHLTGKTMQIAYAEVDGDLIFGTPQEVDSVFVAKRLMAANPRMATKEVDSLIDGFGQWAGGTFNGCVAALAGHPGIDDPNALCAWMHYQALGEWPGEKSTAGGTELTGPIVMKNEAKRIAYAAVLVPGEIDHDGESVTKEKIEEAAHEWMEIYQNVDLQHTLNNVGHPVESYLLPVEMTVKTVQGQQEMTLPQGTWILGSRLDERTWKAVEQGKLTGYSVMGMKRTAMKIFQETIAAGKSTDEPTVTAALKKTLLRDLGPDWVPVYVSVVDRPAVPKAKFFALKAQTPAIDHSIISRIKAAIGKVSTKNDDQAAKEGRRFAKATVEKLMAAYDALHAIIEEAEAEEQEKAKAAVLQAIGQKGGDEEMNEEEIKVLVTAAVKEALGEIEARVGVFEKVIAEVKEVKEVKQPEEQTDYKAEYEALKAEMDSKINDLAKRLGGTRATALKGQDGATTEASTPAVKDRDIFGRKKTG